MLVCLFSPPISREGREEQNWIELYFFDLGCLKGLQNTYRVAHDADTFNL